MFRILVAILTSASAAVALAANAFFAKMTATSNYGIPELKVMSENVRYAVSPDEALDTAPREALKAITGTR